MFYQVQDHLHKIQTNQQHDLNNSRLVLKNRVMLETQTSSKIFLKTFFPPTRPDSCSKTNINHLADWF